MKRKVTEFPYNVLTDAYTILKSIGMPENLCELPKPKGLGLPAS